ncbi:hypothetical protein H2200_000308 [Cladophialophora chaetospira]|uniref:SAM-dependent MTase RsmB/NOP-type domain-containing protein n=1 Tax=Cladophialophora chaetospira TaxID=386627 RepID=A0AA38XP80_9EURO|nr:hypothetical protein H2200_000308 [Cladophialophora chaetospira]
MSLYYDAAAVLTATEQGGSLKSRIYGHQIELKSAPAQVYALISETAKYDRFLKEVVDNAGLLVHEPKLTPLLALFFAHDHLFSRKGIAAPSAHPLRQAIERHKARLQAEFTRGRLRRKCASLDDLKQQLLAEKPPTSRSQPRWVRINTLKSSLEQELATTFKAYRTDSNVAEVSSLLGSEKVLAIDHTIPDLIALPPEADVTKTQSYKDGRVILQDKASCFPACMLIGDDDEAGTVRDCIDGCAAPGNKTSHLAALLAEHVSTKNKVYACERDPSRSKILKAMMVKSGAKTVIVQSECDFLTLDPYAAQYQDVTHVLLDPSCSGSGIVGREDIPILALPDDCKATQRQTQNGSASSKKRKRDHVAPIPVAIAMEESAQAEETREVAVDKTRLQKLSNLQTRIVEHALSFPATVQVSYSTCSVHIEENEAVVARVLASAIAKELGWKLLGREGQVKGLRSWPHRGVSSADLMASKAIDGNSMLNEEELESCIRCNPGDEEGTMGFFVCCFTRSAPAAKDAAPSDDSWDGFSD